MFRILFAIASLALLAPPTLHGQVFLPTPDDRFVFAKVMDEDFAARAAQMNLREIALGQHAQQHAKRKAVQDFGRQMAQLHVAADVQLSAVAMKKRYALPSQLEGTQQAEVLKLTGLQGDAFDRTYVAAAVESRRAAVALYEREANDGLDPDIKAYAARMLPIVKQQDERARQLWKDSFDGR